MTDPDRFIDVYAHQAEAYHRLVQAEDHEDRLGAALAEAASLTGARVVEAGAGTGRVTDLLLSRGAAHVLATEPSAAMRDVARRHLARHPRARWTLTEGALPALPAADACADLAIAGWVVGHACDWHPDDWRLHVDAALAALRRVTRPGGVVLLIESLGTGTTTPRAPSPRHAAFHDHLEATHGMTRRVVRTDYAFPSPEEAAATLGAFFGDAMAARILAERWRVVPECTGVWSCHV